MYLLADTANYLDIAGSYSQIHVLSQRYRYLLGDTGTYLEIQVLTRRYRFLLGDTCTYFEIEVYTYSEIKVLTCRTGSILEDEGYTYLQIQDIE